ncbi:hypothetical protein ACFQY8_01850 [Alloscardovia venturai]|uniref:Uncharacterized protein n=1 Tax=Alloscardovia venturai TaxID=1769421 RepID=A0ABW2Y4T5_9BIFI
MGNVLTIIFWLAVVIGIIYFVVQWAKSDAVINNQASGLSSVERDRDESKSRTPRMAGTPVSYTPQEDIHEVAAQERAQAVEDSTQEAPVYLGDNSSVVPVHLK